MPLALDGQVIDTVSLSCQVKFRFEHHVNVVHGAAGGGDDRAQKRVRIETVRRDGERCIGWIDTSYLKVREVLSADAGGKPVGFVSDFQQVPVPVHAMYFSRAFHRRFPF
jgi:hypothetical protein